MKAQCFIATAAIATLFPFATSMAQSTGVHPAYARWGYVNPYASSVPAAAYASASTQTVVPAGSFTSIAPRASLPERTLDSYYPGVGQLRQQMQMQMAGAYPNVQYRSPTAFEKYWPLMLQGSLDPTTGDITIGIAVP